MKSLQEEGFGTETFKAENIVSLLRFNLNNDEANRSKVLNQVYKIVSRRIPIKYVNSHKKIKSKAGPKEDKTTNIKVEKRGNFGDELNYNSTKPEPIKETLINNNHIPNVVGISQKNTEISGSNSQEKQMNFLFDHILSSLIISEQLDMKLDILTLLEEQYETVLGEPGRILMDKECWSREIAKESIHLFEASTVLSGSNSISVENIFEALTKNSKYSIPVLLQSQALIAFTTISLSIDLKEIVPFWFSKLISILFILCKDDHINIQKTSERNPELFQNYIYLRKFAINCLIEVNKRYPVIFCPLFGINSSKNDSQPLDFSFLESNIHPSIWPENFEKWIIEDSKAPNKNTMTSNDQLIDLVISVIESSIVNHNLPSSHISKIVKEKEKFLTYLVTYIMENLKSVSCWSLHTRILFLKRITKTLSIPSNVLESTLVPFSYSSRIHILFEIYLFKLDKISIEPFSNMYHQIIGILNNFLLPITFRVYSSKWLQFLIFNYSKQMVKESSLIEVAPYLLIPKWHDASKIKYFKSLLIFQLKVTELIQPNNQDFLEIIYESLNSLQEYMIINSPVGAHSVYLKILFKASILFGFSQYISDLIFKYTCHSNFRITSIHVPNTIQLLHLISIHSDLKGNSTLNCPREMDPYLLLLIYLSQKSKLFSEMGKYSVTFDLINSLSHFSKTFLENIHQPVIKWIYMNKVYWVCLSIITNNVNNFQVIHLFNSLFSYIKTQLKVYDTQLLDSVSEIERLMNSMSPREVQSLLEISLSNQSYEKESESQANCVDETNVAEKNLKDYQNSLPVPQRVRLEAYRRFRRQMHGLRDNSFSIFSRQRGGKAESTEGISRLILPFQIKYLDIKEGQTSIYGLKLSFKSSNKSIEAYPVFIPYLRPQSVQELERDEFDEKIIEMYLEDDQDSKVVLPRNGMAFLLLKAKVNLPIPCNIHINLEFNDESGQTFYEQTGGIEVSFQDYFHPLPNKNWPLLCYSTLRRASQLGFRREKSDDTELVTACKLLDIPMSLVLSNINKFLKIFEIDKEKLLSLINGEFTIYEDFDFKHDLLISDSKENSANSQVSVTYRWFCIHLLPKYTLIIQLSISAKTTIVRLFTDFPETFSHCDNFFESWANPI
ncbi:hypothetical protein HWI79_587 [Cryptosporidium felis]|nr:hypothetical protein HWI79_587 [Cryptosporidium felis]